VTAFTAVAKVVTPSVVATVTPTALKHQNSAIATAATVCANSLGKRFIQRTNIALAPTRLSDLGSAFGNQCRRRHNGVVLRIARW
jgi:hypothetical protein